MELSRCNHAKAPLQKTRYMSATTLNAQAMKAKVSASGLRPRSYESALQPMVYWPLDRRKVRAATAQPGSGNARQGRRGCQANVVNASSGTTRTCAPPRKTMSEARALVEPHDANSSLRSHGACGRVSLTDDSATRDLFSTFSREAALLSRNGD